MIIGVNTIPHHKNEKRRGKEKELYHGSNSFKKRKIEKVIVNLFNSAPAHARNLSNAHQSMKNPVKLARNRVAARLRKRAKAVCTPQITIRKGKTLKKKTTTSNAKWLSNWNRFLQTNFLEHVCICCLQQFFKSHVKCLTESHIKKATKLLVELSNRETVNQKRWICCRCVGDLQKGLVPLLSKSNGFDYKPLPSYLREASKIVQLLVSAQIGFIKLFAKPSGGQKAKKGGVLSVPSDVQETIKTLPRCVSDEKIAPVSLLRKPKDTRAYMIRNCSLKNLHEVASF